MSFRLSFQVQIFLVVLVGLVVGFLLRVPAPAQVPVLSLQPTEVPTALPNPAQPLVTQEKVLVVRVKFQHQGSPQILEVRKMNKGRISIADQGDREIQVLGAGGEVLYALPLQVQFFIPGVGDEMDVVERLIVLPDLPEAAQLRLIDPQGEDTYELK